MWRRLAEDDRSRNRALALPAEAGGSPRDLVVLGALGALVLAVTLLVAAAPAAPASAEPASPNLHGVDDDVVAEAPLLSPDGPENLDELLILPPPGAEPTAAERTDAFLAEAVARGSDPLRPSAFRKRNIDLFRTERPVEIGEHEMLLRLRLRAKTRETMSVELRF